VRIEKPQDGEHCGQKIGLFKMEPARSWVAGRELLAST
jgi:hypothetical protein